MQRRVVVLVLPPPGGHSFVDRKIAMPPSSRTRAKTKASEKKPTESDTFQEDVMVTLVSLVTPAKGESNEDKMVLKSSVTGIHNKTTKKRPASPCNGAARPLPVMEHTCSRVHA